ncbi:MAG: hemolysin family protein [bacterium]
MNPDLPGSSQWVATLWYEYASHSSGLLAASLQTTPPLDAGDFGPRALLIAVLAVFVLSLAFFSCCEFAVFSIGRIHLHQMEGDNRKGFNTLRDLLSDSRSTLILILLAENFSSIGAALTSGALSDRIFDGHPVLAFLIGGLGALALMLVLGEMVPKLLAIERAEPLALFAAPMLQFLRRVLSPILAVFISIIDVMTARLHLPKEDYSNLVTEEELKALILSRELESVLESDEQEMITGVFGLGETTAEDVMTPRANVEAFPSDLSQVEMLAAVRNSRHTRLLVYKDDLDHLEGVLYAKELLLNRDTDFQHLLREPLFVPPRKPLDDLLAAFKRERTQLAIVVDEYGGTAGLVTLHDVMEEILGEIEEEEFSHEHPPFVVHDEETFLVQGRVELETLSEKLGIEFPEEHGRTLGGFVANSLGKIPKAGDHFDYEGYRFCVSRMAQRRVAHVVVQRLKANEQTEIAQPSAKEEKPL